MQTFKKIFQAGYSRFPVYEGSKNNIKGVVLAKDLICLDPADEVPMLTFFNLFQRPVFHVGHKLHLNEVRHGVLFCVFNRRGYCVKSCALASDNGRMCNLETSLNMNWQPFNVVTNTTIASFF